MADNRRKELLDIVKKEFIGPDPIEWPGYKQPNGEEILISDPPRTRYIAGILYPQDISEEESSCVLENEMGEYKINTEETEPDKRSTLKIKVTNEYLEAAEELINRSNAYRQSAVSMTVGVNEGDNIRVAVTAGQYTSVTATDPINEKVVTHYLRNKIE